MVQTSYRTYNSYHGVVYRRPNITKQNNEKIHNAISEVSKGDCIIMGDSNQGNIKWDTQQSTGVEDQHFLCLVQGNFLTQHVLELEPIIAARILYGQGSQKLYNWPTILSPPHYRNGVHHTVDIICLYCGELRDVSENI